MMRYVSIYTGSNSLQRSDADQLLAQFADRLRWGRDERVLDVGCGPGDVSASVLMPILPPDASLCGVDIGDAMVEYANRAHANERLTFKVVDFGSAEITKSLPEGHFTKIFSFYCLHWIQDQRQVVRNIRSLLAPGGQALLIIMANITGMTVFKMLEQMEQWKPYMKGIDRIISPYYDVTAPSEVMQRHLSEEGMETEVCEDRTYQHTYPSMDALIDSFMAVNPYVGGVPEELRTHFRSDTERLVVEHSLCERLGDGRARIEYKALVVLCREPGGRFVDYGDVRRSR